MQDKIKSLITLLAPKLSSSATDLRAYIDNSWTEITSRGQEYRLYNLIQALGTITNPDDISKLVEDIVSGAELNWAIVENYCYDYFVLNDMLLQ